MAGDPAVHGHADLNVQPLRHLGPQLLALVVHEVERCAVGIEELRDLLQHALDEGHQAELAADGLGDLEQRGLLAVGVRQLAQHAPGVGRAELAEGLGGLLLVEALLLDLSEEAGGGGRQGSGGRFWIPT